MTRPRFAPTAKVPMAVARSPGGYRSAIMEREAGLVPASPTATPMRTSAGCQKAAAWPHSTVIPLKTASHRAMIRARFPLSAHWARGIPSVV